MGGWLLPIRATLGLLVLFAIGWQLSIHAGLGFPVLNFFSYFTNLANLFAAGVLLAAAGQSVTSRAFWNSRASSPSRPPRPTAPAPALDVLRGAATVYMALVGIVFTLLLRDTDLGALLPWINILLHYVMPVALVLDWLLDPPRSPLTTRHLVEFQILPWLYLAYSLIRGAIVGWYPYPFLSPAIAGGYGGVTIYVTAIVALFFVAGWVLVKVSRPRRELS